MPLYKPALDKSWKNDEMPHQESLYTLESMKSYQNELRRFCLFSIFNTLFKNKMFTSLYPDNMFVSRSLFARRCNQVDVRTNVLEKIKHQMTHFKAKLVLIVLFHKNCNQTDVFQNDPSHTNCYLLLLFTPTNIGYVLTSSSSLLLFCYFTIKINSNSHVRTVY